MSNIEPFIFNNKKLTTLEDYIKMEHSVVDSYAKLQADVLDLVASNNYIDPIFP
jgi:hypothetical protein